MQNITRSHLTWFPAINYQAPSLNSCLSNVCLSATFHRHLIPTSHESFPSCKRECMQRYSLKQNTRCSSPCYIICFMIITLTLLISLRDGRNLSSHFIQQTEIVHPLPDNNYNVCCIEFRHGFLNLCFAFMNEKGNCYDNFMLAFYRILQCLCCKFFCKDSSANCARKSQLLFFAPDRQTLLHNV